MNTLRFMGQNGYVADQLLMLLNKAVLMLDFAAGDWRLARG